jgi:hypothetical protein
LNYFTLKEIVMKNTVSFRLFVSDYEGNDEDYDVTIDLDTWKIEQRSNESGRYSPSVRVQEVCIIMEHDLLAKVMYKDEDEKQSLCVSHYGF